jgi:hypothetical protein
MKKGTVTVGILYWIAGGAVSLIATIALTFASSTASTVSSLSDKVYAHEVELGQLKTSTCIENANIKNLAIALRTTFVSDPNCSNQ